MAPPGVLVTGADLISGMIVAKKGMYLRDLAKEPIEESDANKSVSDFFLQNGNWNFNRLRSLLPEEICDLIVELSWQKGEC